MSKITKVKNTPKNASTPKSTTPTGGGIPDFLQAFIRTRKQLDHIGFTDLTLSCNVLYQAVGNSNEGMRVFCYLNEERTKYFSMSWGDSLPTDFADLNAALDYVENTPDLVVFYGKSSVEEGYSGNVWMTLGMEGDFETSEVRKVGGIKAGS